jgi:hypothetical protein
MQLLSGYNLQGCGGASDPAGSMVLSIGCDAAFYRQLAEWNIDNLHTKAVRSVRVNQWTTIISQPPKLAAQGATAEARLHLSLHTVSSDFHRRHGVRLRVDRSSGG